MDQTKIDTLRAQPVPCFSHLIDGQQVAASDGATMDVLSPIDGRLLTQIARGTVRDMERAIADRKSVV